MGDITYLHKQRREGRGDMRVHPTIFIDMRYFNPNRGRIRRALKFAVKAAVGLAFVYAWWWLGAVACVAAGHGPEVCGL